MPPCAARNFALATAVLGVLLLADATAAQGRRAGYAPGRPNFIPGRPNPLSNPYFRYYYEHAPRVWNGSYWQVARPNPYPYPYQWPHIFPPIYPPIYPPYYPPYYPLPGATGGYAAAAAVGGGVVPAAGSFFGSGSAAATGSFFGSGSSAAAGAADADIHVVLPIAEAKLKVNGTPFEGTGFDRHLRVHTIADGHTHEYTVAATWRRGDRDVTEERKVSLTAGGRATANFLVPAGQ